MKTSPAQTQKSPSENVVQSALTLTSQKLLRVPRERPAHKARGDYLAHLAEMASPDNLDFLDPQAHLVHPALAETLLLKCLMVMMRNLLVSPCPDQWVQWVLAVPLALLVPLDPKVSKDPLVNLVNPVLLVLWAHVDPQDLQERTVKMVKLANLAALVNVDPQAHRVPVVSQELLVFQE